MPTGGSGTWTLWVSCLLVLCDTRDTRVDREVSLRPFPEEDFEGLFHLVKRRWPLCSHTSHLFPVSTLCIVCRDFYFTTNFTSGAGDGRRVPRSNRDPYAGGTCKDRVSWSSTFRVFVEGSDTLDDNFLGRFRSRLVPSCRYPSTTHTFDNCQQIPTWCPSGTSWRHTGVTEVPLCRVRDVSVPNANPHTRSTPRLKLTSLSREIKTYPTRRDEECGFIKFRSSHFVEHLPKVCCSAYRRKKTSESHFSNATGERHQTGLRTWIYVACV